MNAFQNSGRLHEIILKFIIYFHTELIKLEFLGPRHHYFLMIIILMIIIILQF